MMSGRILPRIATTQTPVPSDKNSRYGTLINNEFNGFTLFDIYEFIFVLGVFTSASFLETIPNIRHSDRIFEYMLKSGAITPPSLITEIYLDDDVPSIIHLDFDRSV